MTLRYLQLVIPGALAQLRSMQDFELSLSELSVLEHCLQYGLAERLWRSDDLSHARVDSWQQSLLYALPRECRHYGAASARLSWLGEGGQHQEGSCFKIMPVHFQVGLDDVRCLMPPSLSSEEAEAIFESLKPLVSSAGFQIVKSTAVNQPSWYLWCDRGLKINTFSLQNTTQSRLFNLMPQGADAGLLRQLMTEVQMFLHDHPVNQKRERSGVLPVNALWFYGNAPVRSVSHSIKTVVISDSVYVKGLCNGLKIQCSELPADIHSLLGLDAEHVLLALSEQSLQSIERNWLKDVGAALIQGRIERLDLHLDNWQVSLHGGRWSHWRRRIQGKRQDVKDYLS
jgi:hypothetical protein